MWKWSPGEKVASHIIIKIINHKSPSDCSRYNHAKYVGKINGGVISDFDIIPLYIPLYTKKKDKMYI